MLETAQTLDWDRHSKTTRKFLEAQVEHHNSANPNGTSAKERESTPSSIRSERLFNFITAQASSNLRYKKANVSFSITEG